MASVITRPNGHKWVQFSHNLKKHTLRLGVCSLSEAEGISRRISFMQSSLSRGMAFDVDTCMWLNKITDKLHEKLAKIGLVESRAVTSLGQFVEAYIAGKAVGQSKQTTLNDQVGADKLTAYFGKTRDLRTITPADADAFAAHLRTLTKAKSTYGRLIRRCKTYFRAAQRRRLITENPFSHISGAGKHDESRQVFVSRETIGKVLDSCPSNRWRLIFALARYAGFRAPSEIAALTWPDVRWDDKTLHVSPATKTGFRIVPIAPELMPYLEAAWDEAGDKPHVVAIRGDVNIGTQARRIIKAAGVVPWPKTFQNLRASCETEWMTSYPIQVAARWAGNSPKVALLHYNRVSADEAEMLARAAETRSDHIESKSR